MLRNCLIWILFIGGIRSPPSPRRDGWALPNCNQYQSISNPNRLIALHLAHPNGPLYIRTMTHFEMNVNTPGAQPIRFDVEHHYIRIDGRCRSNLVFSSKNLPFKNMNIKIIMYNDFRDDRPLAVFNYNIDDNYRSRRMKFLDTRLNFGLEVIMIRDAKEHMPTTPDSREDVKARLKNLKPSYDNICIVTENTDGASFQVTYDGGSPVGIITHVSTKYLLNDEVTLTSSYSAFDCKDNSQIPYWNSFVAERNEQETFVHEVHWTEYNPEPVYRSRPYYLKNAWILPFSIARALNVYEQSIFISNTEPVSLTCDDKTERSLYKLRDGTNYWAQELKTVYASQGVTRDSWKAKSRADPCGLEK